MELHLEFDEQVMRQYDKRGAHPVFSIYWTHNRAVYPAMGWEDFGSIILDWWLSSARRLFEGSVEEEFLFMDGPFEMTVRRKQHLLQIIAKGATDPWTVSLEQLAAELVRAAGKVCAEFARLDIAQQDQNALVRGIESLQRVITKRAPTTSTTS